MPEATTEVTTTTSGGANTPENKPTLEELLAEKERMQAVIKDLNNESAGRRKKLEAFEEAEKKRKEAEMTESEKSKAELARLQAELAATKEEHKQTRIRAAISSHASKANFADPDDAWRLLDVGKIEIDDNGQVKGVEDAIKELVKSKPYLVKTAAGANVNATEGRGTPPKPDPKLHEAELRKRYRIG